MALQTHKTFHLKCNIDKNIMKIKLGILLLVLVLPACASRQSGIQRISGPLMVSSAGTLDIVTYEQALLRRFPMGTGSAEVIQYVTSHGGSCRPGDSGYSCVLYYYGTICMSEYVHITFKGTEAIYDLRAEKSYDGC